MPHQCTNCGRTFADGSKEMLSGCPDCGGNKFQFAPNATAAAESAAGTDVSGSVAADPATGDSGSNDAAAAPDRSTASESDSVATRAADTVRDWVSSDSADETTADSVSRSGSNEDPGARAHNSWPSTASDTEANVSRDPDGEFDEWPETARRPEDRAGSSDEASVTGDDDDEWSNRSSDRPTATLADEENSAQADARSEVISTGDFPVHADDDTDRSGSNLEADASSHSASAPDAETETTVGPETEPEADDAQPPEHGRVVSEPSGQRPSIDELRAELNEQFESIKIVRPGQYELNLMELYNRDEYIISLQEDGRYVIDVPDSWRNGGDGDD